MLMSQASYSASSMPRARSSSSRIVTFTPFGVPEGVELQRMVAHGQLLFVGGTRDGPVDVGEAGRRSRHPHFQTLGGTYGVDWVMECLLDPAEHANAPRSGGANAPAPRGYARVFQGFAPGADHGAYPPRLVQTRGNSALSMRSPVPRVDDFPASRATPSRSR